MPHAATHEPADALPPEPRAPALVVFAKAPIPGRVKTRLAPRVGAAAAAELQSALLRDTADIVLDATGRRRPPPAVWCAAAERGDEPVLRSLLPAGFGMIAQGPGDLGERIARVLGAVHGGRIPVLALGADCPDLTTELLDRALEALARTGAALGPAADGGYWAIGLARFDAALFADMPWSTADLARRTRLRFAERGTAFEELPELRDLDRYDDLLAWARSPNPGFRRTLAWCRARGLA
jgi:rSAM/selenodomain-associated transferase 1